MRDRHRYLLNILGVVSLILFFIAGMKYKDMNDSVSSALGSYSSHEHHSSPPISFLCYGLGVLSFGICIGLGNALGKVVYPILDLCERLEKVHPLESDIKEDNKIVELDSIKESKEV